VGGFKRALSIPSSSSSSSASSPSWIDLPPRQESFHSIDLQGLTGLTELLGFEATTTAASSSVSSPIPPPPSHQHQHQHQHQYQHQHTYSESIMPIEPAPTYHAYDDLDFGEELLNGFSDNNSFNFHLHDNSLGW